MAMHRLAHGELERQVLDVLWDHGEPMSPRMVHEHLAGERRLAYTTTMTVMARLWDKGRLVRERAGRTFLYRPRVSREEAAADRMRQVLATTGDGSVTLARFVEALTDEQRAELRRAMGSGG